jgi:hypothetical protein
MTFLSILVFLKRFLFGKKKLYAIVEYYGTEWSISDNMLYVRYSDALKRILELRDKYLKDAEESMDIMIENIQEMRSGELREYNIQYEKDVFEYEKKRFSSDNPNDWIESGKHYDTIKYSSHFNLKIEEFDFQ